MCWGCIALNTTDGRYGFFSATKHTEIVLKVLAAHLSRGSPSKRLRFQCVGFLTLERVVRVLQAVTIGVPGRIVFPALA